MTTFAILASGGDAPGMNAAIRAATRTAVSKDVKMLGALHGYRGLVEDRFIELDRNSVSNIIQRGGAIIRSSRCEEFMTVEGRAKARKVCESHGIDGLILIGGDGTMKGALVFEQEGGPPSIGIPGTIDNDINGTSYTIGFDSAVNTAVRAIDQIRDTAETMEMMFFIETMGRTSGAIALSAGIAGGGNVVIVPERMTDVEDVAKAIAEDRRAGATSLLIIVAEGDEAGGAYAISEAVKKITGFDSRVTVLGHVQRGGNPTAQDRIFATITGVSAVEELLEGKHGYLLGWNCDKLVRIPYSEARTSTSTLPDEIFRHAGTMLF